MAAVDGWLALSGRSLGFDRAVLIALSGGPVALWQAITHAADPAMRIAAAGAGLLVLAMQRRWPRAITLLAATGGGLILSDAGKLLAARPRPSLLPQLDHVTSLSFPSGHALNTMVVALSLVSLLPRGRPHPVALAVAIGFALLVGVSRLALAVHWPTDVIAGWALGGAWALLCYRVLQGWDGQRA